MFSRRDEGARKGPSSRVSQSGRTSRRRGAAAERVLERLGVRGVLIQGRITQVPWKMPKCVPKELGGACHFKPRRTPLTDWMPTADHHPIPKSQGGHLTVHNVRLAHRLCNRIHHSTRDRPPCRHDVGLETMTCHRAARLHFQYVRRYSFVIAHGNARRRRISPAQASGMSCAPSCLHSTAVFTSSAPRSSSFCTAAVSVWPLQTTLSITNTFLPRTEAESTVCAGVANALTQTLPRRFRR